MSKNQDHSGTLVEDHYDLILFGATGFTGGLTAEYLACAAPQGCRWALAGRSTEKLQAVQQRLVAINPACSDVDLLEVDVNDAGRLDEVVASARVVITTVGPYLTHGEPLVAACAASGTDYVDITGEGEFVDEMYVKYHATAVASGARIIHSCGFDSIPHDLGAWWTVQQLAAITGQEKLSGRVKVRGVVRAAAQFSGGTFHSAMDQMARGRHLREAYRKRLKAEPKLEGRKARPVSGRPGKDPLLGYYVLPLPTVDPLVVTRSAAALDSYGADFSYSHFAGLKTLMYTVGGVAGAVTMVTAANIPPVRKLLKSKVPQGTGPAEGRRSKSWFTVDFVAESLGTTVHTRVAGGDPGYSETSKMLAESALCLAFDDNPDTSGQVTTAVAMAENLQQRLVAAGITFELVEQV